MKKENDGKRKGKTARKKGEYPAALKVLTQALTVVCGLVMLVSIGVVFVLNFRPLYYFDIEYLGIEASSGLDASQIRENYDALIDYNSFFYDGDLELPTLSMSESGRTHFAEVKDIFNVMYVLSAVTFVLFVAVFILSWRVNNKNLRAAGALIGGIPLLCGALMIAFFDRVFVLFHNVLFDNDYWLFDPATDPVINILPEEFFMQCGVIIVLFPVIGGAVLFAVSAAKTGRKKNPQGRPGKRQGWGKINQSPKKLEMTIRTCDGM